MSFPYPNSKTDPVEFERMQREYRNRRRWEDAIAWTVIALFSSGVCWGAYRAVAFISGLF